MSNDETGSNGQQCEHDGCSSEILMRGSSLCFAHDDRPESVERRQRARSRGGRSRSTLVRLQRSLPADHSELADSLSQVLDGVIDGTVSPAVANSAASVAKALITVWTAADQSVRTKELEAAIERLGIDLKAVR